MTVTVPESTWRELARRLADDINAVGKMHTPQWRAAVQEVPRHLFVPRYYTDDQQGRSRRWTCTNPRTRTVSGAGWSWCTHRRRW
ncbi:MAG: hypothetical protein ACRDTE_09270 [Pseudonocardiaceae bacterium]